VEVAGAVPAAVDGFGPDAAALAGEADGAVGGAAPGAGAPLVGAGPGAVVVVVVVAGATVTTKKSATPFPDTCPGDVSLTNV
jgi:hypothetical protein